MINKYVPIALNRLYLMLSDSVETGGVDEQNAGVVQELKIKRKYMKHDQT